MHISLEFVVLAFGFADFVPIRSGCINRFLKPNPNRCMRAVTGVSSLPISYIYESAYSDDFVYGYSGSAAQPVSSATTEP
jgi:hypothetical protein